MTEPPDKLLIALLIAVIIISGIVLLRVENPPEVPLNANSGLTIIDGAYLRANLPPALVTPKTYGSIISRIIFCESSGNEKAYNKKSGAKGLLQVIPSSERFCEKGLNKELDMFDPEDNLECGEYLMKHGGLLHWKASEKCWEK